MQSRPKMMMSDDGELRMVSDAEEVARPAVFCIHCGTANRGDAHFCHACGQTLDDQAVNPASVDSYMPPEQKNKRAASLAPVKAEPRRSPVPMTFGMVVVELFTMIVMSMMFLGATYWHQYFISICVLLAWFLVEAARHGSLK